MADLKGTVGMSDTKLLHSPLPWRSVYPLGSKQRCAAVHAGDHYVCLYVAESDATRGTVAMHQANADLIVKAVNNHQRLLDALKGVLEATPQEECDADCTEDNCPWKEAKIAIAEAEAQQ